MRLRIKISIEYFEKYGAKTCLDHYKKMAEEEQVSGLRKRVEYFLITHHHFQNNQCKHCLLFKPLSKNLFSGSSTKSVSNG
jgi:hypothetical protein